jgi:hypothetical protein
MMTIQTNYLYNIWIAGSKWKGRTIDEHAIADLENLQLPRRNGHNIYALTKPKW